MSGIRSDRAAVIRAKLYCEQLESREVPSVTATLTAGDLAVTGTDTGPEVIHIYTSGANIVVLDGTMVVGQFASSAVTGIDVMAGQGNDTVIIDPSVTQPASIVGGSDTNKFVGGGGTISFTGGAGQNYFFGGSVSNSFNAGAGSNSFYKVLPNDMVPSSGVAVLSANPSSLPPSPPSPQLSPSDVTALLDRAAAASANTGAIIAVVDRNGRILGVKVESGVSTDITDNTTNLVFAIDGAVSEAVTGAYFANGGAPLTSRTVEFISQSTITQREVDSNPDVPNTPDSTTYGPGFVAPEGIGAHFPPDVSNTPQVDLFDIEGTNRDGMVIDGQTLPARFNIDPTFVPNGQTIYAPVSYGYASGTLPTAQNRGIATLPGGVPIYNNQGQVVGGIGVFFPGTTGYADAENSSLSSSYNPALPDLSLEAEWMAFAAVGGYGNTPPLNFLNAPVGTLGGVALPSDLLPGLPSGRIDLVGITLPLIGPGNPQNGLQVVLAEGGVTGRGNPNEGTFEKVDPAGDTAIAGLPVADGWLVTPHAGVGITQQQVQQIISQGIAQAEDTRAAIRLPLGTRVSMVFAVTDLDGNVVGLYRQPDATIFSIAVAVAKARNVAYYANPDELQPQDEVYGVPPGTAETNRTFRFLSDPRYPEGIDGTAPGPFSILNDGGTNQLTGLNTGAPEPVSDFQSVLGYDSFNPNTNFRDPDDPLNQNGIVFFPGSVPIYGSASQGGPNGLIGGLGVSGDGVTQDDVVTALAATGFGVPPTVLRPDEVQVRGVNLPYQNYVRNPDG